MDPAEAYVALKGQLEKFAWDSGSVFVPAKTLRALLDGIDLDDADGAARAADLLEVQEERDEWNAQDDKRTSQIKRLTAKWETDEQKLSALRDLALTWRRETADRTVSSDDHDIKRAAELLLKIIR